jgi:diaminohydroxyphosphoribosylaminopyrimidine deaminase/5-amino-6-(5-phosphoribosylamino)uracil reductase
VTDHEFMSLALDLARIGEGDVSPNPLVGAVVVRSDEIVGRGYHRACGESHAEVLALHEAGERARGATLYVTLEPCNHRGKTPPCVDRILEAGIARVVIAIRDPNPNVRGGGVEALREGGVDVELGLCASAARRQNEIFLKYVQTGLPFVHLKLAMSLDGRIATRTGDATWISSIESRIEAHRLRRRHAAILVGVGTVIADDPSLTVRHVVGRNPRPIILDPSGRMPIESRLLRGEAAPIVVTAEMDDATAAALAARGAAVWQHPITDDGFDLKALLSRLGRLGLDSVLIEGGGATAAHFLEAGCIDRITLFLAPLLIGSEAVAGFSGCGVDRIAEAWRLDDVEVARSGPDIRVTGAPHRGAASA